MSLGRTVGHSTVWSDPDREWWGSMWEVRVLQSAFAGDALGRGLATQAELEEISAGWREWANSAVGWLAIMIIFLQIVT